MGETKPACTAAGGETIDLSEDSAFLKVLLDRTNDWRRRVRERVHLASATHYRAEAEYLVDLDPGLFEGFTDGPPERVNVILPLATRDKRPLVNELFEGPAGRVELLLSPDISLLEAEYLEELALNSPGGARVAAGLPPNLLQAESTTRAELTRGRH